MSLSVCRGGPPLGAPRLYWWWDVICPVCQPLSSYSYAIHTVGPPRPLIPVSRGGGGTDSEADRRVGCKSVQEMLNTLSMTERFALTTFSAALSAWGCETKGSGKTCKKTRHGRCCANAWVQTCKRGVPHRPSWRRWPQALPELTYHPVHNNTFVIFDVQTPLGAIKRHLELPRRLW